MFVTATKWRIKIKSILTTFEAIVIFRDSWIVLKIGKIGNLKTIHQKQFNQVKLFQILIANTLPLLIWCS